MLDEKKKKLVQSVRAHYKKYGRHDLPWRKTTDPYDILVSEIMLQQTQVARVQEKYKEFLKAFPTVEALARAPLSSVLRLWSGLGYNRRAKYLHESAKFCVSQYSGKFPKERRALLAFPGIGPYTASAVCIFAFNLPEVCIETNIRTVYLHHLYPHKNTISDTLLLKHIANTVDTKNPRQWYWALMDYGSFLKSSGNRVHRKSANYTKQSPLKGSLREARGYILKQVVQGSLSIKKVQTAFPKKSTPALEALKKEGFISIKNGIVRLV